MDYFLQWTTASDPQHRMLPKAWQIDDIISALGSMRHNPSVTNHHTVTSQKCICKGNSCRVKKKRNQRICEGYRDYEDPEVVTKVILKYLIVWRQPHM